MNHFLCCTGLLNGATDQLILAYVSKPSLRLLKIIPTNLLVYQDVLEWIDFFGLISPSN